MFVYNTYFLRSDLVFGTHRTRGSRSAAALAIDWTFMTTLAILHEILRGPFLFTGTETMHRN